MCVQMIISDCKVSVMAVKFQFLLKIQAVNSQFGCQFWLQVAPRDCGDLMIVGEPVCEGTIVRIRGGSGPHSAITSIVPVLGWDDQRRSIAAGLAQTPDNWFIQTSAGVFSVLSCFVQ